MFRHTLNRLYGGIVGDEHFLCVHVGAVVIHLHGEHLEPEFLAHQEVSVVAWHWTYELRRCLVAPGTFRSGYAEQHGPGDRVIHQIKAAVTADNDLVGCHLQKIREQALRFRNAGAEALVPVILIRLADILAGSHGGQDAVAQVELIQRRFAARHIQHKIASAKVAIARLRLRFRRCQGLWVQGSQGHIEFVHMVKRSI